MAELFSALRAPQTLGLAGMMRPEARVYHETLFDLNGVGRVSDLFAARLRKVIPDELAFRAVILHGVVDAFRTFTQGSPIRIECGLDSEKIGITICFSMDPVQAPSIEGLRERITLRKPKSDFEQALVDIVAYSGRVYFKHQPSSSLAEICILSSFNAGQVDVGVRHKGQFEALLLAGDSGGGPSVAEYTLLADLDYRKLLKSSREGMDPQSPYSGEVLLHEAKLSAGVLEAVRMRKLLTPEEPIATLESYKEADAGAIRVKGVTQKLEADTSAIQIDATPVTEVQEDEFPASSLPELEGSELEAPAPRAKKRALKKRGFLRRLFGFSEPEAVVEEGSVDEASPELLTNPAAALVEDSDELPVEDLIPPPSLKDIHKSATDLEQECEKGGLSKLAERVEKEGVTIRDEVKNSKAEKWIEGLAAELVVERAKIAGLSKKLLLSVRQKELEFRNRENALLQSVKSKDETLRSRTLQVLRMKDQVAKLQLAVERARANSDNSEESAAKIKLTQTQRLLQNSRSEVEQLNLKLQEMKARFEQMSERGRQTVPSSLYTELQRKSEKLAKQLEDLKRSEPKSTSHVGSSNDDSEAA